MTFRIDVGGLNRFVFLRSGFAFFWFAAGVLVYISFVSCLLWVGFNGGMGFVFLDWLALVYEKL